MQKIFVLGALAAVSACVEAPEQSTYGEIVPFAQVLSETQGRPFECYDYDPATRSCISISTNRAASGGFVSNGRFLISADPPVEMRGVVRFEGRGSSVCAYPRDVEWEVVGIASEFTREMILADAEREFADMGEICGTYYRSGDGYIYVGRDENGQLQGDGPGPVVFLASEPRLRFEEPEGSQ